MSLTIELAKPSEIGAIIDMLLEMHAEISFKVGPPDRRKITDTLALCDKWLCKEADAIAGLIALRQGTVWYSASPFLADQVFYVKPAYRASGAARLLLRKAKEQAKIKNLPLLVAANSGDDIDRKTLFYKRLGFTQIGASFTLKDHP
jgi:GNAT superfamily N-acetyltransferase